MFPSSVTSASAKGILSLRQDGVPEKLTEKEISIPANGQIVGAFTDFFPERQFTGIFAGTLEFIFDQDVYFTGIVLKTTVEPNPFAPGAEAIEEPTSGSLEARLGRPFPKD